MNVNRAQSFQLDWMIVLIYLALVFFGYFNILSASADGVFTSYFDLSEPYGKQTLFIGLSLISIVLVLSIDAKFYERFASIIYLLSIDLYYRYMFILFHHLNPAFSQLFVQCVCSPEGRSQAISYKHSNTNPELRQLE